MKKIIFFCALFVSFVSFSQQTYIYAGKMVDTFYGKIRSERTIIVEGDSIAGIENGYKSPDSGVKVIDLKDKTVLPGLIDMHVHIESETNPRRYVSQYIDNEADLAFDAALYAKRTLQAGFTTVRDLGGSGVNVSIKKAIEAGKVEGPRIFTAEKAIATTGGHADPTNGSNKKLQGDPGPKEGVINSPEEGKKAVRQRYKNGADCIKITATGGVLSVAKNGSNPQFTIEEIKAITSTAKDYGMHVAAHAHGDKGMRRAINGGVKTIEHGTYMSLSTMKLMKKKKVYLVPTITAGKEVEEKAKVKGYFPAVVVPKALAVGPLIQGTFSRAYKNGVPIAFGTDAGVFPHGQNAREFGYMVEAGMPASKAIQAATVVNAKLLGMAKELGQLKKGFAADIIAVDDNPFKNVKTLESVSFVMKGGKVYKK